MLARYAATVKNLRGVLLFSDSEEALERIRWLTERFKYRNLGVIPSLSGKMEVKKPFVELVYPDGELIKLTRLLGRRLGEGVAEAVVLSSTYVSPLFVLDGDSVESLRPLEVGSVRVSGKLTDRDWKLHLRIADYTVLDFYRWSVESAEKLWTREPEEVLEERAERIRKDAKRYWRIEGKEREFLLYLDPVRFICEGGLLPKLRKLDVRVSAGLAIGAAVCLLPETD